MGMQDLEAKLTEELFAEPQMTDWPETALVAAGEQRAAPRRRVLLTAKLVCDGGWKALDCTVRDLSESGARVEIGGGVLAVPQRFDLHLANGEQHACEVVRIAGEITLDVRFVDDEEAKEIQVQH